MRRLENKNREDNMEYKRIKLEEKIKENKSETKRLFSHLNSFKKEYDNLELDIKILDNFNHYTGFEDRLMNSYANKPPGDKNEEFQREMTKARILNVCMIYFLYQYIF
jgi:hypothetical protein